MPDTRTGMVTRVVHRVKGWSDRVKPSDRADTGSRTGPDGLPLPTGRLRRLVAGTDDVEWFLQGGLLAATGMRAILERSGVEIERLGTVLDFGCGAGRVLRHWKRLDGPLLHGTDYNPELVDWCAANLPIATFGVNRLDERTDYPSVSFDLIYAFSVFTHLAPAGQSFWIAELTRILKPGGHLFLTTHGDLYLSRLSLGDQERFRAGQLVVLGSRRAGSNDCAAFHPETYVRQSLAEGLDVVDFVRQGALGNPYQDAYLLRKPG